MIHQTKSLLSDAARQFLWESLNRHHPDLDKPDIALVGSRRSGSTLLMQILAHAPRIKSVDQPFSVFTATRTQMRHLPWPAGGIFVAPDRAEIEALTAYVENIRSGRIHVREPWRFWRPDFWFRSDRVVLKTTDAHFLLPHLRDWGLQVILYFRHPVPQALSCHRNGWGDRLDQFAAHHVLRTKVLTPEQNALLDRMRQSDDPLPRFVLGWCIENLPLFHDLAANPPTVFYEDLVLDPDGTIDRLGRLCNVTPTLKMRSMLGQASLSVRGLSDTAARNAIARGNAHALVGRWREHLSDKDLEGVRVVLDAFSGCPYGVDETLPRSPMAD